MGDSKTTTLLSEFAFLHWPWERGIINWAANVGLKSIVSFYTESVSRSRRGFPSPANIGIGDGSTTPCHQSQTVNKRVIWRRTLAPPDGETTHCYDAGCGQHFSERWETTITAIHIHAVYTMSSACRSVKSSNAVFTAQIPRMPTDATVTRILLFDFVRNSQSSSNASRSGEGRVTLPPRAACWSEWVYFPGTGLECASLPTINAHILSQKLHPASNSIKSNATTNIVIRYSGLKRNNGVDLSDWSFPNGTRDQLVPVARAGQSTGSKVI